MRRRMGGKMQEGREGRLEAKQVGRQEDLVDRSTDHDTWVFLDNLNSKYSL